MDITNSEKLHTKDNGPLQTKVSTSAIKTHSYFYKPKSTTKQTKLELPSYCKPANCCTSITYCLLHSLVTHSCINPKSLAFGYLDKKPIDAGLMKFFDLCPSALSWYLEFASAFSTSSAPFRPMLSLYKSKGLITPRKSGLCGTMALPSPRPYYLLPCICVPSFAIGRSASTALWRSSGSTSFLTDT
ncbi:hypothetical protein BHM03_00020615 [Ensete ventricosum]|nr:hypothetical protein BHM03_00020615 [Ensete ventricosum]